MTAEEYLKKFEGGYPEDGQHIKGQTKKEIKERIGKFSMFRDDSINELGRYSSGLKAVESFYKDKNVFEAAAEFLYHKENIELAFNTSGFDKIRFGFLHSEIEQIALVINIDEHGESTTSGTAGAIIGGLLLGRVGRHVGQAMTQRTVKGASSNERVNVLAIHTKIDGKENVICILFKYSKFQSIEEFFNINYADKLVIVN